GAGRWGRGTPWGRTSGRSGSGRRERAFVAVERAWMTLSQLSELSCAKGPSFAVTQDENVDALTGDFIDQAIRTHQHLAKLPPVRVPLRNLAAEAGRVGEGADGRGHAVDHVRRRGEVVQRDVVVHLLKLLTDRLIDVDNERPAEISA